MNGKNIEYFDLKQFRILGIKGTILSVSLTSLFIYIIIFKSLSLNDRLLFILLALFFLFLAAYSLLLIFISKDLYISSDGIGIKTELNEYFIPWNFVKFVKVYSEILIIGNEKYQLIIPNIFRSGNFRNKKIQNSYLETKLDFYLTKYNIPKTRTFKPIIPKLKGCRVKNKN